MIFVQNGHRFKSTVRHPTRKPKSSVRTLIYGQNDQSFTPCLKIDKFSIVCRIVTAYKKN